MYSGLTQDTDLESSVSSLIEQAFTLETKYKGMLLQGDEVDERIQIWRKVLDVCKTQTPSNL
jgi:hypothetical protein